MERIAWFFIAKIALVITLELFLIFSHLVIYTETTKTGPSDLLDNPVIAFLFYGDATGFTGGINMFMALVFGFATPIAAFCAFYVAYMYEHRGWSLLDPFRTLGTGSFVGITAVTFVGAIIYEFSLLFGRLISAEAERTQNSAFLESLGVATPPAITSGANPAESLAGTIFLISFNLLIAAISARIIHGYFKHDEDSDDPVLNAKIRDTK